MSFYHSTSPPLSPLEATVTLLTPTPPESPQPGRGVVVVRGTARENDRNFASSAPVPHEQRRMATTTTSMSKQRRARSSSKFRQTVRVSNTGQSHECDVAKVVVVSHPGISKMMGSLHPAGALYEKPLDLRKARSQHAHLREALSDYGVVVYDVVDILAMNTATDVASRCALEDLAAQSIEYRFSREIDVTTLDSDKLHFVSEEYKMSVLEAMSVDQLTNAILTRPVITIKPSGRDTNFTATYSFTPLTNLVFCRDQQITTRKGVVMARLRSQQRHGEVQVMRFCLQKLGLQVIGDIPEGASLEGGDFFPLGKDLCMVGVGLRSNVEACEYMMENDLLGTRRVAVVRDDFEREQDRMHLDTVFNIVTPTCVVALEDMLGADSPTKRLVDEYVRERPDGPYKKMREGVEFEQYLTENGFTIIRVTGKEQLEYGCNILNLGDNRLIAVNKAVARKIARSGLFDGRVEWVDFSEITAMYGAVHCATQVVLRAEP